MLPHKNGKLGFIRFALHQPIPSHVIIIPVPNIRNGPRLGRIDHLPATTILRRDRFPGHILNGIRDTGTMRINSPGRVTIRLRKVIGTRTAPANDLRRVLVDRDR